nr:uncharacterized protein CI109_000205 [Kwoniella shandongensis]KAA5531364.1 hypothetical protein CI109_000205 [Kwoniella shandongensis]
MTILNTSSSSSPSSSVSSASSLSSSSTSTTSSPCTSFDVVLLPQPRPHPLILDDEQVWQAWFDYPAKQEMTLHRWAQNLQSELREYILSLSPSPTKHQIAHLLHLSHRTAAALKILILGSILLVRGITPGPLIGKTLFTTLLGERYNDTTMFDTKSNGDEGMRLVENERMLSRSVIEASKLKENGDLLSSMGRLSAALEHYGLALVRLTPWNPSIISIELSQQTGFAEL